MNAREVLMACDHHVFFVGIPKQTHYRCECGEMFGLDRVAAYRHERSAALAALESSGYTVAKLEQVGRVVQNTGSYADVMCWRDVPALERNELLFRIVQVDDQEETK